jgi:hypothetical protein
MTPGESPQASSSGRSHARSVMLARIAGMTEGFCVRGRSKISACQPVGRQEAVKTSSGGFLNNGITRSWRRKGWNTRLMMRRAYQRESTIRASS